MHCPFSPSLAALALLVAIASGPRALAQAKMQPAVAEALAKATEAHGAELPATLAVTGSYAVSFEGAPGGEPVAKGGYSELFRGGAHARSASQMGENMALERGVTPELAWEVDPMMGAKRYDGPAGAAVRRYFALLRGERPERIYQRIERREGEAEGGALVFECFPVGAPNAGSPDVLWFDPATMLLTRVDIKLPSPDSAGSVFDMADTMDASLRFADWREVGGVRYAFSRRLLMGPAVVATTVQRVEPDAELPAERFAAPKAAAELKPRLETGPIGKGDGKPEFVVVERDKQLVACIRTTCKPTEISATLAKLLPEVMAQIGVSGGKIAGPPYSRYHSWEGGAMDIEAGIPVAAPIEVAGRVKNGELPGGKVVSGWHIGPYEKLTVAHQALQAYLKAEKLAADGGPWEIYWTDPGMVPDSAKWRTQLLVAVKSKPAK